MHNVNILGSGYTGIYFGSSNLENVVIESSFICHSATFGIKVASSHIALLNVSNCSILENRYGVNFDSLSGSISIEDTKISNSTSHALYINVPRSGGSTYYLTNSSLTHCKGLGIVINGYYGNLRLVVTGTFWMEQPENSLLRLECIPINSHLHKQHFFSEYRPSGVFWETVPALPLKTGKQYFQ